MSTTALSLSLSVNSPSRGASRARFALQGAVTVVAAVVANALLYLLANTLVAYDQQFLPLASVGGPIIMTVAPAILAVPIYAVLLRFTRHPARIFTIISAIVFAVTLIPVFTYIPTLPGVTDSQIAVLLIMHLVAASVIVRLLTLSNRRNSWES